MKDSSATALLTGIALVAGVIVVGEAVRMLVLDPYFPRAVGPVPGPMGSMLEMGPMSTQLLVVVGTLFGACAMIAVLSLLFAEYTDPYHGDRPA